MAKKQKKAKRTLPQVPPAQAVATPWWERPRLVVALLFVASFLLYANTLGHAYAQDDAIVLYDNAFTTQGIAGIPDIFAHDTFYGFFQEEGKANLVAGGRYRPFSLAVLAVEYQIFGDRPGVYHFFNAFWYALTVVVLYLLLLQMLRRKQWRAFAGSVAFGAALLFCTHPIHTEAVANIKGRDEIFSLLGSLAALYLMLRAYRTKQQGWLALAGLCFFIGLSSKENAITIVAVAPLTMHFFTRAKLPAILLHSLPFVGAALLFILLRTSIVGLDVGDPPRELMNNPFLKLENGVWVDYTFVEKMAAVFAAMLEYLRLLVVPHPLSHDYYPRAITVLSWADWRPWAGLLAHVGLLAVAIKGTVRRDPLSYAIWFYLLTLSIFTNILFPIGTHLSERFLFMPSVGFALATAWLAFRYLAKAKNTKLPMVWIVIGGLCILYALKTVTRNAVWENNYTLFTTDINVQPNSAKLRNAVGGELINQATKKADGPEKTAMLTEAVGHLNEALRIHPTYKNAYFLRGIGQHLLQNFDAAIADYQRTLDYDTDHAEAYDNMVSAYRDAGKYYGEKLGNTVKAIENLEKARSLAPDDLQTIRLLGVAYGVNSQHQRAIDLFQVIVDKEPDNAGAWLDLGAAYYNAGQQAEAQIYIERARSLDPEIEQKRQQANQ